MRRILIKTLALCVFVGSIAYVTFQLDTSPMSLKQSYKNLAKLPFGTQFTDHMFIMEWNQERGWHNSRIETYKRLSFDPSSLHMHYGQGIFEGMKAFRTIDNRCVLFRPLEHLERMNASARIMCMPEIDVSTVLKYLKELLCKDRAWIPSEKGTALYIRPTMIATEPTINLKPSACYLFFIILSPVGSLYQEGFNPVDILVCDTYTRASMGSVGEAKTGGNYAASMRAQQEAKKEACAQVLWLDPVERRYIEEVGSMNIFFITSDNEIITPELTGTILRGITRKSVLSLSRSLGFKVTERRITIDEIIEGIQSGTVKELFGTGTAAGIAPIGSLRYKNRAYVVNDRQTGPITKLLYDSLTKIQYGIAPDAERWLEPLPKVALKDGSN